MAKGDLLSVREDVRVVDATLRDGGLCNDFYFTDKFVKDLYNNNVNAGVDYMEFGYKASKDMFDPEKFGKWKFCDDEDIRKVVGENKTPMKIAVMADVGRCNYKRDIRPKKESPVDLVRIATYINTIPVACDMIEHCHKLGYETSINIMAISKNRTEDICAALDIFGKTSVDTFYIVDSYGAFYPEQIRKTSQMYLEYADKYKKNVGIHAHNNQSLAFANTIDALQEGVSYLDATVMGMGRGAGNCQSELLIGFLKNPKYNVEPILAHIENHMMKLKEEGVKWGFDIPYILTGQQNSHPRSAIAFQKENRTDYRQLRLELLDME
ncbi:MAG: aldolase catalytic domain-containing protein [Ruminococcus sp.]